ncbi:hypothetical protein [Deinococcus planocerae]|uniref:hypothetical protein n=1 Tax=Deinococcus planocerae TaxID=1737569 RepID=UPI0011AEDAC0|nr:hypothetical protein [Deinococcus planocerae]
MSYKKPFALVFNPIWIIGLQTVLALILIWGKPSFTLAYVVLVSIPAIVYLVYALIWERLASRFRVSASTVFGSLVWKASIVLIVMVSLGNIFLIGQLVELYGGLTNAIANFGRTQFIIDVQYNAPRTVGYLISLNYILPVAVVPLVLHKGIRLSLLMLALPVLLLFAASNLYGARILFLDTLVSIILTSALLSRLRVRLLMGLLISGVLLIVGVAGLQAARYGDNLGRGFEEMGKYYSISLSHGSTIVSQNRTGQPLYWTLRSTFGVPLLSEVFGTQAVYEGVFGHIPIKSREDDFAYAARLGVDPRYNTFSIYGYSFLDLGVWGLFVVLFSYLSLHYMYSLYISMNPWGVLLYPALYALLLDQLRTNSIFSTRVVYFIITTIILMFVHKISTAYRSRVGREVFPLRKAR